MLTAERTRTLPPYIFSEIDREIRALRQRGQAVINLGISDPDQAPKHEILDTLLGSAKGSESHRYPPLQGIPGLRRAVADWYRRRFGVRLDPDREVLITQGSKEALIHLSLAVVDSNGLILVPDPGYPAYSMAHALFGFEQRWVPLIESQGYLPVISQIRAGDLERAQLMYVNYPNNPTGAMADRSFWQGLVDQARRWDFVICSDLAYADIVYEGRATSVLEIPEARSVAVESITFSKSFNMQGWRLSAMVGSPEVIDALYRVESQVNGGVFTPIQEAGMTALELGPDSAVLESYRERRQTLGQGLAEMGLHFEWPRASVYFWVNLSETMGTAEDFARRLLHEARVAVTPGTAFGPSGVHQIRVSFTSPLEQIVAALQQWQRVFTVRV